MPLRSEYEHKSMTCDCAALLGLVNELIGGSLIAPAAQELRPTAAATQWADTGGSQEVPPQAWASLGVALTPQVPPTFSPCTHYCSCSVLIVYSTVLAMYSVCSCNCAYSYTHSVMTRTPHPCTLAPPHPCALRASHVAGPHVSRH